MLAPPHLVWGVSMTTLTRPTKNTARPASGLPAVLRGWRLEASLCQTSYVQRDAVGQDGRLDRVEPHHVVPVRPRVDVVAPLHGRHAKGSTPRARRQGQHADSIPSVHSRFATSTRLARGLHPPPASRQTVWLSCTVSWGRPKHPSARARRAVVGRGVRVGERRFSRLSRAWMQRGRRNKEASPS